MTRRSSGWQNYATVLSDRYWWTAFVVTLAITVVSVAIEFVLGMALALVMHRTIFGKGVVRTAILIPYGIVTVAASYSWYYAWTPGTGYLANLLPQGSAPLTATDSVARHHRACRGVEDDAVHGAAAAGRAWRWYRRNCSTPPKSTVLARGSGWSK